MNNVVDHAYIDHLKGHLGETIYRKKPIEIQAYKIDHDFVVETLEGTMHGQAGDFVIVGIQNELYICKEDIFKATYDYIGVR